MKPDIFRAYDIRGIVGKDLDETSFYDLGRALGTEVLAHQETSLIVARDGRLTSPALSTALIQGVLSTGCHVIDIGCVPTPVLYFATHILNTRSGVMVTASHNPPEYNGAKIVIAGNTFAEAQIQGIYQRILRQDFAQGQGKSKQENVLDRYMKVILDQIHLKNPLKIVLDCGNGVTGGIAPGIFRALGCEVIELFCEVDGHFPNHPPDPSEAENLEALVAEVKKQKADLGIAFDGDGDRMFPILPDGSLINPDRILMLYAEDILKRHPGATILYDVKCSRALEPWIQAAQGQAFMWKTGHALIKKKMPEIGALLAGEFSGHFFFKENWYGFDDGIYSAARLLKIIDDSGSSLKSLLARLPDSVNTPEIRVPVQEFQKAAIIAALQASEQFSNAKVIRLDGIRVEYEKGWGLIRASNTSPYLIIRFEADDAETLAEIRQIFNTALQRFLPGAAC